MTDATRINLGCGDDQRDGWCNVDIRDTPATDLVVDLNDTPWPWPDDSAELIVAKHVFEHLESMRDALNECHRILQPDGRLKVVLPMGVNADADGTHLWGKSGRPWTWQRPEFECGKRGWDPDCGLTVVDKSVEIVTHLSGVQGAIKRMLWRWQHKLHGPGEWCFTLETMSGEFTVVFEA